MVDRVLLARPRGFCAGVEMAIKALTWMTRVFSPPVYCYHQIVHNAPVVAAFQAAGVVFVDEVTAVPPGAPVMLSAHGSGPEVAAALHERTSLVVDAVCPLVTKVHHEVRRMAAEGYHILYVGHEGHDEAVGTIAQAPAAVTLVNPAGGLEGVSPPDLGRVALVTQTTLGHHEWEDIRREASRRFAGLWTARRSDLCYATTNRQAAVQALARRAKLVLVVGSATSSNTRALVRVARAQGAAAHRVDGADSIDGAWLPPDGVVGVTAGASAPEAAVQRIIERLAPRHGVEVVAAGDEAEYFPPPPQLRAMLATLQAVVEGGYAAARPGRRSPVDDDRSWSAGRALDLLADA